MAKGPELVSVKNIQMDGGTQPRAELRQDVIDDYAEAWQGGADFPPVIVFYDGKKHWLADGFHRTRAAQQAAVQAILADVRQGEKRDAILFSCGANTDHGLRRTNADKRRAVERMLADAEWQKKGNREIARHCAVDEGLVRSLRTIRSETVEYSTKHGTPSTMSTKNIGRHRADAGPAADADTGSRPPRSSMDVHYQSGSPDWKTPPSIVQAAKKALGSIDLDPCSNAEGKPNVPAKQHYTEAEDGLAQRWTGRVYMNPPYGRVLAEWIKHLCSEHEAGRVLEAIALVPARTDTAWFRRLRGYPRCFVFGRLKFSEHEAPAPFPSMAVYLGSNITKFCDAFADIGDIYELRQ